MKRRVIGVLLAVGLTLFGTALLVGYVHGAESRAVAGERVVDVLVVAQPIKKGTPATALDGKVKLEHVPARVRPDTAVTDLGTLKGLVATADLALGEELVQGRFGKPDTLDVAGAVDTTNLVKFSVSLDPERAVAGQLKTGDLVTVAVSAEDDKAKLMHIVIHQVPIVNIAGAVASTTDASKKKTGLGSSGSSGGGDKVMLTLALTEQQAGLLVWGVEHGSIYVGLEPPKADQSNTGTVNLGTVFG